MNKHLLGYISVFALFVALCAPTLFSDGMFLDGVTYAAISKNMAEGFGSFWAPYYSDGLFPDFHEHPPLALGLQAIFFKVFGDSIFVERLYSLATFFVTGGLIMLIWKRIRGTFKFGWLPLLLWFLVTDTVWACSNNMLENTMMIFTTLSCLWILKAPKKGGVWLALAGISLFLGLLCKGFTCLYIWSVPFFLWVFQRKESFGKMFLNSAILVAFAIIPLVFLLLINEKALDLLLAYYKSQVVGSIKSVQTVNSRFTILLKFLMTALPSILLFGTVLIIGKKKGHLEKLNSYQKLGFALLAITFSGILPIMVSLKQRGFYILTVYPFFALGSALILIPIIEQFKAWKETLIKVITGITIVLAITLSALNWGTLNRDNTLVEDCKLIINHIGEDQQITVCSEVRGRYNIVAYFARYGRVSLMLPKNKTDDYYMIWKNNCFKKSEKHLTKVKIPTKEFHLYKKQ